MAFQRAERKKAWMKIVESGPSGSGKTFSALLIAKGMGGRIAVIDTENGSASLYAGMPGMPEFDVLEIDPPYEVKKYTAAINEALQGKYDILIIDSLSHAWAGEGGLLQKKEEIDARGGRAEKNKFANWGLITKEHEQFKAWLLKADIHIIATMRSKQDYVLTEGNVPKKVGMAPIQRDGMEYEFTTAFDLAMNHTAQASKDRTGLFPTDKIFTPNEATGAALMEWLKGGSGELVQRAVPPEIAKRGSSLGEGERAPSDAQLKRLFAIAREGHWLDEHVKGFMAEQFQVDSSKKLNRVQYDQLCNHILANPRSAPPSPEVPF